MCFEGVLAASISHYSSCILSYRLLYCHTGYYTAIQVTILSYRLLYYHTGYYTVIQVTILSYRLLYCHTGYYTIIQVIILSYRYKAKLRYEGCGSDSKLDFWVNICSPDVHEIGWCATNKKQIRVPISNNNSAIALCIISFCVIQLTVIAAL